MDWCDMPFAELNGKLMAVYGMLYASMANGTNASFVERFFLLAFLQAIKSR